MGGFLGIGKSGEEEQLEAQNKLKQEAAAKSRKDAEIRLAERKAKKGQETAKVKLGVEQEEVIEDKKPKSSVSSSLGIGGAPKRSTGIQL